MQLLDGEKAYEGEEAVETSNAHSEMKPWKRSEVPVNEVLAAKSVTLNPVYDYRERVREVPVVDPQTRKMVQDPNMPGVPAMQPMRTPLVMPVGFTLTPHPVHVPGLCFGTDFRFLSQMDPRDAETQRGFAKDTREGMKAARAQMSGLSLATPEEIVRVSGRTP